MSETLTPVGDRILVRLVAAETVSRGGIIIPDTAKEKPMEGVVISIGAGRQREDGSRIPVSIPVGARVVFAKYAGTEIKLDGVDHMILGESEVLGILS